MADQRWWNIPIWELLLGGEQNKNNSSRLLREAMAAPQVPTARAVPAPNPAPRNVPRRSVPSSAQKTPATPSVSTPPSAPLMAPLDGNIRMQMQNEQRNMAPLDGNIRMQMQNEQAANDIYNKILSGYGITMDSPPVEQDKWNALLAMYSGIPGYGMGR